MVSHLHNDLIVVSHEYIYCVKGTLEIFCLAELFAPTPLMTEVKES